MVAYYVGELFLGKTYVIDKNAVYTKFFCFGIPLFPMQSYYGKIEQRSRLTGIPIRMNIASVARAYFLFYGTFAAAASLLFPAITPSLIAYVVALLGIVVWTAIFVLLGRVSSEVRLQRRALKLVTGSSVNPAWLPDDVARRTLVMLDRALNQQNAADLLSSSGLPTSDLRRIFAMAVYGMALDGGSSWSSIAPRSWYLLRQRPDSDLQGGRAEPSDVLEIRSYADKLPPTEKWQTISARAFRFPTRCCACLAPTPDATSLVSYLKWHPIHNNKRSFTVVNVPSCEACRALYLQRKWRRACFGYVIGILIMGTAWSFTKNANPGPISRAPNPAGTVVLGAIVGAFLGWPPRTRFVLIHAADGTG